MPEPLLRQQSTREPKRVRVAVIGAGTITQSVHLPAIRRLAGRFDLGHIADLSAERARRIAESYGDDVRWSLDPATALADDRIDAVLLATPGSHGDLARQALEAGMHVLAEKPLTLTVAEAEELGALAAARKLVLQVGYMKMHDPVVPAAATELAAADGVRLVRATVLHPADAPQVRHLRLPSVDDVDPDRLEAAVAVEDTLTTQAVGDIPAEFARYYRDVLNGSVIHELSLLRALGLPLPERFEEVTLWPWPADGEPPCLLATAPLDGGEARLVLSWNWLPDHPEYGEELAIFARNRRLRLDLAPPYLVDVRSTLTVEDVDGARRRTTTVRDDYDTGFVRQLESFADSIQYAVPVRSDTAGVVADLRCLQALMRALGERYGFAPGGEAAG